MKTDENRTKRKYDFFPELSCEGELRNCQHPFGDIDLQLIPAVESISSFQKPYFEEDFVSDIGFSGTRNTSCWQSMDSDRLFISSDISLDDTSWYRKYLSKSIPLESSCRYSKRMSYGRPVNQNRLKYRYVLIPNLLQYCFCRQKFPILRISNTDFHIQVSHIQNVFIGITLRNSVVICCTVNVLFFF